MSMQRRKVTPIGRKGQYFEPKAVEGGAFGGRVWKRFVRPLNYKELREIIDTHERYVGLLNEFGIRTFETKLASTFDGKKYRLSMFQERVDERDHLDRLMGRLNELDVLNMFENFLEKVFEVYKHNEGSGTKIFLDPKLENFALRKGILYRIDTFPPGLYYKGRVRPRATLKYYVETAVLKKKSGLESLFLPARRFIVTKWLERTLGRKSWFRPALPLAVAIHNASELRPELTKKFKDIAIGVIERKFGNEKGGIIVRRALSYLPSLQQTPR